VKREKTIRLHYFLELEQIRNSNKDAAGAVVMIAEVMNPQTYRWRPPQRLSKAQSLV
jgi:hypothetical protein